MSVTSVLETPYERSGVISPGLPILPHGVERHPVPAGGTRALRIEKGDEFSVLDFEGLQAAELTLFAPDGSSKAEYFGAQSTGKPTGITEALQADRSGVRVANALKQSGFDLAKAEAVVLFGDGSKAGDMQTFHAQSDGLLVVCAVGTKMLPDAQNTVTDIIVYIRRANSSQGKGGQTPPDPLADPVTDFNILPGHAQSYEVKAGQFVQILDVQGRECSDFQALSKRALDAGRERDIDPTTTRSLMGSLYPAPGIFAKYFSMDMEPLIEIVQDTCGRHDTFGLACTARYYEDLGYPGHANCSDNINADLSSNYDVKPRGGWPAINFFFNTMLDDTNAIGMDDPWSRPGDYVLLRALTDLVCISSACPCDVDPANGWNPSDIQVRVYNENEPFKQSIGWRKSVEGDVQETKETGFHECFARYTRDFIEYNGYWLAKQMSNEGAIAEYWAAREKAVVMDLSPLRKYEVTGPDAEKLMQLCVTRNMKKLAVGQVIYTAMCYEHGGMIDDGTVFRLGENNFRWVGGNDEGGKWMREQAEKHDFNAWVRDSTSQLCNIAVQGPLSRDILKEIVWTPATQSTLEDLGWFRFAVARLGDFHGAPAVVSRTGYSGELGYEIFCHPKDAVEWFDAVNKVGEPLGMIPLGLAALDMLRIEAGLVFAGSEFSDQTDPYEAGIGFTVPLKTQEDHFIGRPVLEKRKENPQKKLVGLDIEGGVVPSNGDCVRIGKAQVGEITSAMKSPKLGKVIALARVDVTHAEDGTAIEVGQLDGEQKRLKATVCRFPHYDPDKTRVRS
ncbi:MAG: DUF1989 domain-containing protein [Granulosicoccaceae bacterium]